MEKANKKLLAESIKKQFKEIEVSVNAIKTGNIDALVIASEQALNVYTETTADKPYRILIEKMHEGAATINEEGIILYCNSSFANLVNLPLQKVLGSKFEQYIDESSKSHIEAILNGSEEILKEEVYLYASGGKKIPVMMSANALWLDTVFAVNIILTDLTLKNENKERLKRRSKQLEEKNKELVLTNEELQQLLQLNADKDRFISILAHDLRSPFSSILGFLSLLSENIHRYSIDEIEEHIKFINQSAQNAFNLLEDLILWTMSQSGKLPYKPQKLSFTEVCKEVVEIHKPIANAKRITIDYIIPTEITVIADINMLKTVLRNLVSNAIKFTNPGGKIEIRAKKTEDNITISVSDNGIGMDQEIVNTLFDISKTHTTKGTENESGTGLGLFLCKEFIEKHGSEIKVNSRRNVGSSFSFTLLAENPLSTLKHRTHSVL